MRQDHDAIAGHDPSVELRTGAVAEGVPSLVFEIEKLVEHGASPSLFGLQPYEVRSGPWPGLRSAPVCGLSWRCRTPSPGRSLLPRPRAHQREDHLRRERLRSPRCEVRRRRQSILLSDGNVIEKDTHIEYVGGYHAAGKVSGAMAERGCVAGPKTTVAVLGVPEE